MQRVSCFALALGLALALSAGSASAQSRQPSDDERETARSLMDRGLDARKRGELEEARKAFRAAHAIMKLSTTGLELARTLAVLGRLLEARAVALEAAETTPKPGERAPLREARAAARELADEIASRLARIAVTLRGFPKDTVLWLDGETMPMPTTSAPLDPGKHVLRAQGGTFTGSTSFTLAEGELKTVTVVADASPAQLAPGEPPKVGQEPRRNLVVPITLAGVSVAALATGSIFGAIALGEGRALRRQCPNDACPASVYDSSAFQDDLSYAKTVGTISTVSFVIAGVALAGAATSFLLMPKSEDRATLLVGPGMVGYRASF